MATGCFVPNFRPKARRSRSADDIVRFECCYDWVRCKSDSCLMWSDYLEILQREGLPLPGTITSIKDMKRIKEKMRRKRELPKEKLQIDLSSDDEYNEEANPVKVKKVAFKKNDALKKDDSGTDKFKSKRQISEVKLGIDLSSDDEYNEEANPVKVKKVAFKKNDALKKDKRETPIKNVKEDEVKQFGPAPEMPESFEVRPGCSQNTIQEDEERKIDKSTSGNIAAGSTNDFRYSNNDETNASSGHYLCFGGCFKGIRKFLNPGHACRKRNREISNKQDELMKDNEEKSHLIKEMTLQIVNLNNVVQRLNDNLEELQKRMPDGDGGKLAAEDKLYTKISETLYSEESTSSVDSDGEDND